MNPLRKAQILEEGRANLISPPELFNRLLHADLSKCKCNCADEEAKILQQKVVLQTLINQYISEIQLKRQQIAERDQLLPIRNSLKAQIQLLVKQRKQIARNLQNDIHAAKQRPLEIISCIEITAQLKSIQHRNQDIQKKIQQSIEYISKMEYLNENLSVNRNIKQNQKLRQRKAISYYDDRITILQRNKENYISQMQARLRYQQVQGEKYRRMQEAQIAERNRRRWEAFQHHNRQIINVPQIRRSVKRPYPVQSPIRVRESYSPPRVVDSPSKRIIRQPIHNMNPHNMRYQQHIFPPTSHIGPH